jgi:flagellar biosynthetic protein FliP
MGKKISMGNSKYLAWLLGILLLSAAFPRSESLAQERGIDRFPIPKINFEIGQAKKPQEVALSLQILLLITVLTLAPSIILMVTSFTRIIIVLDFIKRALGLQQMPPNQVIAALSLFLTFFIMAPTLNEVNSKALKPFMAGQIGGQELYDRGIKPIRKFMFKQIYLLKREKDIALFIEMSKIAKPKTEDDVPTHVLIPAFMISELRRSFEMGIIIFIPFIVLDMVVSSVLMAMGMIMLPPVMISLPLKIVVFILVDGWNLITYGLVKSLG